MGAERRRAIKHLGAVGNRGWRLTTNQIECLLPQVAWHGDRWEEVDKDRGVQPAPLALPAYFAVPDVPLHLAAQAAPPAPAVQDGGQFLAVLPVGSGYQQHAQ